MLREALISIELFSIRGLSQVAVERSVSLKKEFAEIRRLRAGCLSHRFFPKELVDSEPGDRLGGDLGSDFGNESRIEIGFRSQDRLGEVLSNAFRRGSSAVPDLVTYGILIWVPYLFQLGARIKALILDVNPGALLIIDHGEVEVVARGITPVLRLTLEALANSTSLAQKDVDDSEGVTSSDLHVTKEDLFSQVWGYEYDPLRHNNLLYQVFSRIRHILGSHAHWVVHDERGYQFAQDLSFVLSAAATVSTSDANFATLPNRPSPRAESAVKSLGTIAATSDLKHFARSELNWRQTEILKLLRDNEYIDVARCMKEFKTSDMTARRDLVGLVKMGMLRRSGRARATKYGGINHEKLDEL